MKIVLIRHGKPNVNWSGWVSALEFGGLVSEYDEADLDQTFPPTIETINSAAGCQFSVCSHLTRSIESAKYLNLAPANWVHSDFRECETPYAHWRFLKLPIKAWIWLFRVLQLTGYSNHSESYQDFKKRSEECANQLIKFAEMHGSVVFIGHGILNLFLHKALLKKGWIGSKKSPKKYWSFGEYFLD
ncbi:hypothetical protein MNBD_GAMMA03-1088 [hydrothermal vent metagenome]|uniref:Phosphoglycerate mutase family protein n=1 Tax=hydrothermal vent metagenome TaxID=652676 RepID=A0A3B0W0W2_9ZZZZ